MQHTRRLEIGEERLEHLQIDVTNCRHRHESNDEHQYVQHKSKQLIRLGHLCRAIADEQQVLEFGTVLLHKQIDAQHEDVERKDTDNQSHSHHNCHDDSQHERLLASIEFILVGLVVVVLQIGGDARW